MKDIKIKAKRKIKKELQERSSKKDAESKFEKGEKSNSDASFIKKLNEVIAKFKEYKKNYDKYLNSHGGEYCIHKAVDEGERFYKSVKAGMRICGTSADKLKNEIKAKSDKLQTTLGGLEKTPNVGSKPIIRKIQQMNANHAVKNLEPKTQKTEEYAQALAAISNGYDEVVKKAFESAQTLLKTARKHEKTLITKLSETDPGNANISLFPSPRIIENKILALKKHSSDENLSSALSDTDVVDVTGTQGNTSSEAKKNPMEKFGKLEVQLENLNREITQSLSFQPNSVNKYSEYIKGRTALIKRQLSNVSEVVSSASSAVEVDDVTQKFAKYAESVTKKAKEVQKQLTTANTNAGKLFGNNNDSNERPFQILGVVHAIYARLDKEFNSLFVKIEKLRKAISNINPSKLKMAAKVGVALIPFALGVVAGAVGLAGLAAETAMWMANALAYGVVDVKGIVQGG